MITLAQYWMGRDSAYEKECTLAIRRNAAELLAPVNTLLRCAEDDGVEPAEVKGSQVASGWRPLAVNDHTSNAAKHSRHIDALAVDLHDHPDRSLARWCLRNISKLEQLGLYMEMPRWTGGKNPWVHLQRGAPASGRRVYIPSMAPPTAVALPEEAAFA